MRIVLLPYSRIQPVDGRFKRLKHVVVSFVPPYLLLSSFCCFLTAPLPCILYWLTQRGCLSHLKVTMRKCLLEGPIQSR